MHTSTQGIYGELKKTHNLSRCFSDITVVWRKGVRVHMHMRACGRAGWIMPPGVLASGEFHDREGCVVVCRPLSQRLLQEDPAACVLSLTAFSLH